MMVLSKGKDSPDDDYEAKMVSSTFGIKSEPYSLSSLHGERPVMFFFKLLLGNCVLTITILLAHKTV